MFARFDPLAVAPAHVNTAESFNAMLKRAWVGGLALVLDQAHAPLPRSDRLPLEPPEGRR